MLELVAYMGLGASGTLGLELVACMVLGPQGLCYWSWWSILGVGIEPSTWNNITLTTVLSYFQPN